MGFDQAKKPNIFFVRLNLTRGWYEVRNIDLCPSNNHVTSYCHVFPILGQVMSKKLWLKCMTWWLLLGESYGLSPANALAGLDFSFDGDDPWLGLARVVVLYIWVPTSLTVLEYLRWRGHYFFGYTWHSLSGYARANYQSSSMTIKSPGELIPK